MKTVVYGSWHLAEVYAVGLCELGHSVRLVAPPAIIEAYRKGRPPVYEPGIAEGIKKYVALGTLSFSKDIVESKNRADVCFFAQDCKVTRRGVDMADISGHFEQVAQSGNFKIIAVSSQLPIGTCKKWQETHKNVQVVYYPEFLRLGDGLKRFKEPDYLVLGGPFSAAKKVSSFFSNVQFPKFFVSLEEAEMTKHAANIFVAMSVSFLSELTKFSEHFNINLEHIGEILRFDKRVGSKAYVMPGMGFSGETLERDIKVLLQEGKRIHKKLPLFQSIISVNVEHNRFIERELRKRIKNMKGKKIGFIGATYKPFTSTLRGSLVRPLMATLAKEGARIALYDPQIEHNPYPASSLKDVFSNAHAVVITVGKKEFKKAPYQKLVFSMKNGFLIDAANMITKSKAKKLGIEYVSIGRGNL